MQRGRISAQALKRAARVAFLSDVPEASVRTRDGVGVALKHAVEYAATKGLDFDEKAGRAAIKKVVDGLAKAAKDKDDANAETEDSDVQGDNILFFATSELQTLAVAAVEAQADGATLSSTDCIQDARSASLDVAAFGRMFAAAHDLGTHAAVAVSHSATTHPFALTADYFSAVDDAQDGHGGAGHIGMTYYTSGTYYRTFTIDLAQLRRSWSRFGAEGSRDELSCLVRALITALPSGRVSNSNPHTLPAVVLVEQQRSRCAYDFDEPIEADGRGYKAPTLVALAAKRRSALRFDPNNFGPAVVAGEVGDLDFAAEQVETLDDIVATIVDAVYGA
ncbi:type I-E CRISPR-associated protein Cas7/Cse4/CasC [Nocardioides houyundeii]|uniref:type I-E CRISPR-associated protein Cas7/Cse4/CasC n=1 Tax=Nocardioides houyundeii TaxID=2045452 RepID=UPI001F53C106|nr:type I-E CRISPR-associated protein Cas7/Cse4/CasC [Nocardioides houyundeii]